MTRLASMAFFLMGLFLIGQALWPIASWYLFVSPEFAEKIVSPLASTFPPLVRAAEAESYEPGAWFKNQKAQAAQPSGFLKSYVISIPKLEIEDARVSPGGDLKKSLVAWPTSGLPGAYGNNIVFGHSELPQFANPKNYSGIFTHIMELEKGDEIFVDYDGIRYRFEVQTKKVVEPTDISVLEQRFDASYITLITCVPPGTLWKRGIVQARLAQ